MLVSFFFVEAIRIPTYVVRVGQRGHVFELCGTRANVVPAEARATIDARAVTREGRTVASVLSFYFRDEVLPYYGGGTLEARECAANDFMYWELMRRACERGLRVFDYGRSKLGSGSYDFKKNWGFAPQPLHYEYLLVRGKRVPDLNPMSPKYSLAVALWRRLPQPLVNAIGPHIVRNLG